MKILIVHDTYYPDVNGAAIFTHRLALNLKNRGHDILVIAPSTKLKSHYDEHEGVKSFRVRSFPVLFVNDFRFSPGIFTKSMLKKVVKEFAPDLIHFQGHFFLSRVVFSIAGKLKIPVMGTNHFMPENLSHYLKMGEKVKSMIESFGWWTFNRMYKNLTFVTSPTQSAANLLYKNGFSKNVEPISCGIDLEKFNRNQCGKVDVRKKYSLPDKPIMIFVGRLDREKNVDFVLKAFKEILKIIDIHFLIVGKGTELVRLKELSKELKISNHVTFTGYAPDADLPDLYGISDCFVLACEAELQSIATMQAMGFGLPVVAVDAVALPELVHDGENGYLFKPKDLIGLSESIVKIFSNDELRAKMGEQSLKIIQKHSINDVMKKYEDLYQNLLKKN